jgi:tellurium resistance protein TerD
MTIVLGKGQGISLSKTNPSLSEVFLGVGWDVPSNTDVPFDLDAFAFLLSANDKLISDSHLIFYNNLTSPDPSQSVQHQGDNSTGVGEGDDEVIKVNLKRVPAEVQKIVFAVTIFDAEGRNQNFGQVENAFVRLVNAQTQEEILHYNLAENYSVETALIMAELYRETGGWAIKAVGTAHKGGAQGLIDHYAAPPQAATNAPQQAINWRYRIRHQNNN